MFFTPKHVKEGRHYRHALKRLIHYKKDILPARDLAVLQELLARLQQALKSRNKEEIYTVRDEIERAVGRIAPPPKDAGWRENVEVFLVAIVIAAGVRAYFLQPFKIPDGFDAANPLWNRRDARRPLARQTQSRERFSSFCSGVITSM